MPNLTAFDVSYAALWIVVLFQMLVLLDIVHRLTTEHLSNGGASRHRKGDLLVTGSMAPRFELPQLSDGQPVSSDSLRGKVTMLVFISPDCVVCRETAEELVSTHRQGDVRLAVLCHGDPAACAQFASTHLPDVLVLSDETGATTSEYRVKGTPTAVLLDPDGRVHRYGFPRPKTQLDFSDDSNVGNNH